MSTPRKDSSSTQTGNGRGPNGMNRNGNQSADTSDAIRQVRGTSGTGERGGQRALSDPFVDERDDVLSVINELEDQLDRNEQIRENLEREIARITEQSQSAATRIQELEWQAATLQTNIDALNQVKQENTLLEEELADANTRSQRTGEQLARAEKETVRLTEELRASSKQVEELWAVRKERDGLRVDIKNARTRIEVLERTSRELTEERTTLQARLQEAQTALEESRAERNQIELLQRASEDRNAELKQAVEALEQKLEDARNERKTLQAQITRLERENARYQEQQQFFEVEVASLRNMNRNTESALANVKKAFSEVRIALTETKSRARRRSIEALPRIGATLRGLDETETTASTTSVNATDAPTTNTRDMVQA